MAESRAPRSLLRRCIVYVSVAWIFILAIFPFYWMLITSLKTNQEIYSVEANPFYTLEPTLTHYAFLFRETLFGRWLPIAVPLALPELLSVFIFAFTLSSNEFIYAMTLVNDVDLRTVPVGTVVEMIRGDGFWWGSLMGAALLASVPVAVLYSFFVDYFVAGLTAGAVKG